MEITHNKEDNSLHIKFEGKKKPKDMIYWNTEVKMAQIIKRKSHEDIINEILTKE